MAAASVSRAGRDQRYAPGMRVEIRDAEWRIKRVDASSDGGYVLSCDGLSELVQGREALFLTRLEQARILDPRDTVLVDDTSSNFGASLLYIDSMLRKTAPSDEYLHLGHHGAIDSLDYQLKPALQALKQPRQRILMADAVGLGKTLEAGILTSELMARGRGKRILVLAVKSMLTQFQQEFWNRFTIPLVRLDSVGLARVRRDIPANHNPFHYFDRAIISIDTLKQDIEYRHYLEQAWWDIIIIDEAHNVADRGSGSQRAKLAKLLATRSDTLIMLSATPHDGKAESFASLMNMLDPTAIANPRDYGEEDFRDKGLVIRRFKKDVREELSDQFPDRRIEKLTVPASIAEEAAYDQLMDVTFHTLDGRGQGVGQLFRTTLEKALFSSPAACLATVRNRSKKLERHIAKAWDEEKRTTFIEDLDTLHGLESALKAITPAQCSKYQLLLEQLAGGLGWTGKDPEDRLVIFTESIPTLEFLQQHLPADLKLKPNHVGVLRGDMRDRELADMVDAFNRRESPLRLLLCSDVAAEGINLHHMSHRMVHFDIPWSLMVFQQRNGRIDRYGQTRQPQITYLLTESDNPRVRGDQRILEVLIEKDEQAGKNIGDPSEFMGLHDEQAEAETVADAMEEDGPDAWQQFQSLMEGQAEGSHNPLAAFTPEVTAAAGQDAIRPLSRIFPDNLSYARAALTWLAEAGQKLDGGIDNGTLWLTAPDSLRQRLAYLPPEIRPEHDRFTLTQDIERISHAIQQNRQGEESAWPELHYLWPLHPVMEWLSDRALHAFGRHTAPVLRVPGKLAADEHIVLMHGGFPNRRGHVLIQDWVGVHFVDGEQTGLLDWVNLSARLDLVPGRLPNAGNAGDTSALQALLPDAVVAASEHLKQAREQYEATHKAQLDAHYQRLAALQSKHEGQLQLDFEHSGQTETLKQRRRDERQRDIERIFGDYRDWLANTQATEDEPYLQVVAVFTGAPAKEAD